MARKTRNLVINIAEKKRFFHNILRINIENATESSMANIKVAIVSTCFADVNYIKESSILKKIQQLHTLEIDRSTF